MWRWEGTGQQVRRHEKHLGNYSTNENLRSSNFSPLVIAVDILILQAPHYLAMYEEKYVEKTFCPICCMLGQHELFR